MKRVMEGLAYWYMDRGLFRIHMLAGIAAFLISILLRRFDWATWTMLFFFSSWGFSIFFLFVVLFSSWEEEAKIQKLGGQNVIGGEYYFVEPRKLPKPN